MPKEETAKTKSALNKYLSLGLIAFITLSGLVFYGLGTDMCSQSYRNDLNVNLANENFNAEKVSTEAERNLGLSGRSCIGDEQAMLFVFDAEGRHGFWMKDMNFNIDIVWLDKDKKVVHIENNVPKDSYPKVYYPDKSAQYVIELNAGVVSGLDLKIFDQAVY
jgi:uncharacterized protein